MGLTPDTPDLGPGTIVPHYDTRCSAALEGHMGSEGHMCPLRMCPSIHGEECDPPRGRRAKLVDSSLVNCYDNESALRPLGLRLLRSVAAAAALACTIAAARGLRRIRCRRLPRTCTLPLAARRGRRPGGTLAAGRFLLEEVEEEVDID